MKKGLIAGTLMLALLFSFASHPSMTAQGVGPSTRKVGPPDQNVEFSQQVPDQPQGAQFISNVFRVTDMSVSPFDPPSPDPSGLTYLPSSNTLLMVDGEVEETVDGITHFQGVNVWELTLTGGVVATANISTLEPTLTPITDEPTGTAFNPNNGHYYFTDDNANKIFVLDPGDDGQIGSDDDAWTNIALHVDNGDAEGITFDAASHALYVADGIDTEIFRYSIDGVYKDNFDVEKFNIGDPESVEYNPDSDTLFILGDPSAGGIIQTTPNGQILRTIDISSANIINPAGLAYAPASDGSGDMHFYIVDRGLDNDGHPNVIDGRMFEMTAPDPITPGNQPPYVDAGADQSITLPTNSVQLDGTVTDDGIPNPPGKTTAQWSQETGPCQVDFDDRYAVDTGVSFQYPGDYVLRLTADDGELQPYERTLVTVKRDPALNAFDLLIAKGEDDVEESDTGSMRMGSVDLELINDDVDQQVGLRFNRVDLPSDITITQAYLQFTVDETGSEATSLTIQAEDAANALPFQGTLGNLSSRPKTSAAVTWDPAPWTALGESGPDQRTPNLAPLLQEIIQRPDWVRGNSMALIITGTGRRTAVSYDGNACGAPLLHIEYIEGINMAPAAADDAYATNPYVTLSQIAPGVLENDSDPEGGSLTAVLKSGPGHGTLSLKSQGAFIYIPEPGFVGVDSFTYVANDGLWDSNTATVTIMVEVASKASVYLPMLEK